MTRHQLAVEIAHAFRLKQPVGKAVLDFVLGQITECVVTGEPFRMDGLGTIVRKTRKARKYHSKGEVLMVPDREIVVFRPSRGLLEKLNPSLVEKHAAERRRRAARKKSKGAA